MGKLIEGKWHSDSGAAISASGAFQRNESSFRNWITPDGAPGPSGVGGFKAEAGRYHLYVSTACPWAHRTLIFRALKGLTDMISVDSVIPLMLDSGWEFAPGTEGREDSLTGRRYLREIYQQADPAVTTRATVPILWDKQRQTIVSNESAEIIRMFNSAFDGLTGNTDDYCPAGLREQIDRINARIYRTFNNGVYRAGFARSQSAYDAAVADVFETLDWLEELLSTQRYLLGDRLTEADWRLFPTLARFDLVYHFHFKCSRNRLVEMPNLWAYARELYQHPGISGTVFFDDYPAHYFASHDSINPYRIIPQLPKADWSAPHGRG
ncbi:glutathione S-transferase family protein [Oceanibium sediminis]|uniref:glutathione S-transferase family protein n=1 Tax=Oceanibium sediminis TaxID=2026339 RepID=UPI000DD45678|nr:glutathione S-transferase family protein [Oceanibium sediminis]